MHVILNAVKDLVPLCEARFPSTYGSGQASPAAQNDRVHHFHREKVLVLAYD
jgi:hypothetical protein